MKCLFCNRRVWWFQSQGWRFVSSTKTLIWHPRCRTKASLNTR